MSETRADPLKSSTGIALLSVVLGAIGALGLAPFDLWPIGIIGFGGLIFLAAGAEAPRAVASRLGLGGLGYFALALHWIVEPFFVDAARHGWMAPIALPLLAGGMALFWALPGYALARLIARRDGIFALGLALAIALGEFGRAYLLSGFPWAHPGHVLISSRYIATAAWIGPHGLTLIVLGFAAGLSVLARRRLGVFIGTLCLLALWNPLLPAPTPTPVRADAPVIRLVQPNAPQDQKWDRAFMPIFFQRGLDLTAGDGADLIVWPETSLPELLRRSEDSRSAISRAATGTPVIVGAQDVDAEGARNLAALLDADGMILRIYRKHHLVPFGEYIPLRSLAQALGLSGLADVIGSGFVPGEGPQVWDLGPLGRAYLMICYEAIFPQYPRQVARPDWMLHLTNDAWFGSFSGPYQHLALARLRAVEQGLPVLRAANTGVSAVIDAEGHILAALALNEAGALNAALPPPLPPTFYARWGDWPFLAIIAMVTAALIATSRYKSSRAQD